MSLVHPFAEVESLAWNATVWSRWPRALIAFIALAVASATSSRCTAQTLDLGQAAGYSLFAVSDSSTGNTGSFNFSNSTVEGSAALGAYTYLGGMGTITGNLSMDSTASFSGVTLMGSMNSGPSMGSYLGQLSQTVISAATTAENSTTGVVTPTGGNGNYQINGNAGLNVITVNSGTNSGLLSNATITINGTSNEQFVFNISSQHNNTTLNGVTVLLNGVSASNVFYNFINGNVGINSSNLQGNVLDVISGKGMSIDNSVVNGTVMSDGFVDMANSVIAPEMPTIAIAGLGCLIAVGGAGIKRLRRAS